MLRLIKILVRRYKRKPFQQKVTAEIPIGVFAGNVALMATISDISPSVLHKVTGANLAKSGADLTDFKCSLQQLEK